MSLKRQLNIDGCGSAACLFVYFFSTVYDLVPGCCSFYLLKMKGLIKNLNKQHQRHQIIQLWEFNFLTLTESFTYFWLCCKYYSELYLVENISVVLFALLKSAKVCFKPFKTAFKGTKNTSRYLHNLNQLF